MELLLFLPCIILLGIITSIQDVKFGKIKNIWIIIAIAFSIIVNAGLITFYWVNGVLNLGYVAEMLTNLAFAIAVGFGLWASGIWTAGDGKLFIAYCALIPPSVYSFGYQKYFPAFALLVNLFAVSAVILVVFMLFKLRSKNIKNIAKQAKFEPKKVILTITNIFAVYWIVQILLSAIGADSYLLRIFATIILLSVVQKKLKDYFIYIALALSVLRLAVDSSVYSIQFLMNFIIILISWGVFASFASGTLSKLGREIFSKEISIKDLKPGMVMGDNKISAEPEGLTKSDIQKLKRMKLKKVRICQTLPFAPFMFLGVIITLIAKGNLLIAVMNLF